MNNLIKRYSKLSVVFSIILILLGFLLVFNPKAVAVTITTILGIGLLFYGVVCLVRFFVTKSNLRYYNLDFTIGIVFAILGIIFIFNPQILNKVICILLGIGIIMQGAFKFQYAFQLRDMKEKNWRVLLCIALVTLIGGLIILFNPNETGEALIMLLGIIMVIEGIINVIEYISLINVIDKLEDFMK